MTTDTTPVPPTGSTPQGPGGVRSGPPRQRRTRHRRSRWAHLTRSSDSRVIAGVAGGLGRHLGIDPILVRIVFAVLAFAGGTGIVLYGVLWAIVPLERDDAPPSRRPVSAQQGIALVLIALGVLGLLRAVGLWFGDGLVLPVLLAAAGSAIVWSRSDREQRAAWSRLTSRLPGQAVTSAASAPASPVRIVVGTLLVGAAIAGFLAANDALGAAGDLALTLLAAVVGLGLLFGPWLWRLVDQLGEERRQRIRQEERAELAAHLHDSVLQTLALIQRSADQPRRMVALARRQERELRAWLYGGTPTGEQSRTLATALHALTEELEAAHEVVLEVVVVGDGPVDDTGRALLAAIREACTNAIKHAGVPTIDVYLEVDDTEVVTFVRDRGRGFDPGTVPGDRQGIRRSIVERLSRHGGQARIRSAPGEGTEVELVVPRMRETAPTGSAASPQPTSRAASPTSPPPSQPPPSQPPPSQPPPSPSSPIRESDS